MANVTIDINTLLTDEQRQKIAEQIWEENQETIKNNIRKALHQEMQSDVVHRVRKIISEELVPITKAVLKEKLPQLEKDMAAMVDRFLDGEAVVLGVSDSIREYLSKLAQDSASRLHYAVQAGISRMLQKGEQSIYELRKSRRMQHKDGLSD